MKMLLMISVTLFFVGCATTTDRFKMISTQTSTGKPIGVEEVKGKSCRRSILFIPYELDGTLEDAVENALANVKDANALTDLKVKREVLFTIFYNYRCTLVEGKPAHI